MLLRRGTSVSLALLFALSGPAVMLRAGSLQPAAACRWANSSVTYVDQSGSYAAATRRAAENWSNTAASVSLSAAASSRWLVLATDMGGNGIYGYTWVSCVDGVLTAAVSLYNTHYTDDFTFWQRVSVMTHEMGHGLGLPHARSYPPCPVPIMDRNLSETIGLCKLDRPQAEDVRALMAIYGVRARDQVQGGIGSR